MNPYMKFGIKSVTVFGGALSLGSNVQTFTGADFNWVLFLAPAVSALLAYWGGVVDSMPAPWVTPAEIHKTADALAVQLKPPTPAEEKTP
jgi:hypothetical protein